MKTLPMLAALVIGTAVCGGAFAAPKAAKVTESVTAAHVLTKGTMKKKVATKKTAKKVAAVKYKSCGTYAYWHKKHKKCWDARYNAAKT